MTPEQIKRLENVENLLAQLVKSDRYTISRLIQFMEGRNIQLGTASGTMIGTAATQKLAVLGATPVVQAGSINAPTAPSGSYVQAEAASAVAAINSIRTVLKNFGISA